MKRTGMISLDWKPGMTSALAALHFLVDGLCVCCLFQMVELPGLVHFVGLFVVYNVVAFLTQPLTGMLADRLKFHEGMLAAAAVLLSSGVVIASLLFAGVWPGCQTGSYLTALLLGLGNSLFHVWGGRLLAVVTANDARSLGVFVSTGVLGLTTGVIFHSLPMLYGYFSLIVFLTLFIVKSQAAVTIASPRAASSRDRRLLSPAAAWLLVLALMVFVMLRSSATEAFSVRLDDGQTMALAIGVVAMSGKMVGGWLTRWLGASWSLALMVFGALICFMIGCSYGGALLAGLFLVNCTMPVTLYLANKLLPGSEGLAFGLLAAALMPGYLMVRSGWSGSGWMLVLLMAMLLPTVVIELVVLWQLRERRPEVLWSSVVLNVLTNVPLNLFLLHDDDGSFATIAVAEAVVVVVETLWYRYFVGSWQRAAVYSLLCNGISYLVGLLTQLVLALIVMIY